MAHGAPVKHDTISLDTVAKLNAQLALVEEALREVKRYAARCAANSEDPRDWQELVLWRDRLDTRTKIYCYTVKGFIKSQDRG